ncbi:hypothetical protein GIB67_040979, partial [Kingdonia uniflora]
MLGEIPKVSGTVEVFGSIAYVSQTSWIQSGTIRDNILYGKPMSKLKYENAIKACALDKDINSFKHGDLTEIGQRGLNMSGGQKQRIQFARAVYNDADIYHLDDPFIAVDAHTASTLFNDCVMGALEKKTVVLVTHQVEFLVEADKILEMEGGEVTQSGSYEELLTAGTAFEQLVNGHKDAMEVFDPENSMRIHVLPVSNYKSYCTMDISDLKDTYESIILCVSNFDIPFSTAYLIASLVDIVATICVMAYITWQVLIMAIASLFAINYVQGYYLASAKELIRINGTTTAPIMNYAAETSLGVVTIRAFFMMDRFFANYLNLIDTDAKLFFHSNAAMEWLIIRAETLQNLTLFTAALLLVLLPRDIIAPDLSLSYALSLTGNQVYLTRWYCSFANYIISVERIKQFMHIPTEPSAIIDDRRPPSSWPYRGRIDLQDLKIQYRLNAPLVLEGITCSFKEGTRVGVVGRTGNGKTTLLEDLRLKPLSERTGSGSGKTTQWFRLVEPLSGRILIDGLDICSIGLRDLGLKPSIIPQEPTLFRGTVRTNLDPLGLYSDQQIWE